MHARAQMHRRLECHHQQLLLQQQRLQIRRLHVNCSHKQQQPDRAAHRPAAAALHDASVSRRDWLVTSSGLLLSSLQQQQAAAATGSEQDIAEQAAGGGQSEQPGGAQQPGQQQPAAASAEQLPVSSSSSSSSSTPAGTRQKRPLGKKKQQSKPAAMKPPGTVPRVRLTKELEVSQIIHGCWQLDGQHKGDALTDRTTGAAAIEDLDTFCRHGVFALDTADIYGPSEAIIGQHLRLNPGAAQRTKVLSKLSFMTPPAAADLRRQNIEYRVRSSMARLGVTKLDLVQLHWEPSLEIGPRRGLASKTPPGFVAAAQVLQQLAAEGVVGGVGVSNFDVPMLMALLDAGVTPVSNQVAFSVIDRRPSLFLSRFCQDRGIHLLPYGTLAGGFLAERYRDVPANLVRIDTVSKARYGTLLRQLGGWTWLQDMLMVLHEVAAKHGVTLSTVAARWVLQQPAVAALVLGSRNTSHLRDTQRIFSFRLDEVDMLDIDAAYEGANQPTTDVYAWERGGNW